ncbi:MAG: efflux RND transporter permease subunit [Phycisphaerales bacterium]|nr:MAG: efflux RND transporter permease subunit [Phycisphaerales bacterium]
MVLSTLSVRRPVLAGVMCAVILVFGLVSLTRLEMRQYPNVDAPVVSVITTYRGASAAVVDAEVTKRLLDRLGGVEGIRTVRSASNDGESRIDIEFVLSRNIDLAAADVRDQINRARDDLPVDVDEPTVRKASSDASPIMWLSLTSDRLNALELTDYVNRRLVERFSLIDGVARTRVGGERRYSIRLWLDREAMAARAITVEDIENRLLAENLELPGGRIESRLRELSVRTLSRLTEPREFERLVVRTTEAGPVRVGDVARVSLEAENDRSAFAVNGRSAVSLGIIRQSNANTVDVANAIRHEVDIIRHSLPDGVDLSIASDDSIFIKASIRGVLITLAIALALVIVVIVAFLRSFRAALVPIISIPVSVMGAVTIVYAAGFSVNVLTLLAAVLAIGLVVDDSIVVLENIERRIRMGEPRLAAAVRGAGEVGFAVIATTVVLVAVFVPLAFLTGQVGRLFTEFGLTLAGAVIISSFVALSLGVMLCSKVLPERNKGAQRPTTPAAGSPTQHGWIARQYGKAVGVSIRLRWLSVAVALLVTLAAAIFHERLPRELTPSEDQGRFVINVEGPEGASLEHTVRQVRLIEDIIDEHRPPHGPIMRTVAIVAPGFGGAGQVNTARIIVRLVDWSERDVSQLDVVNALTPRLREITGARVVAINPPGLGIRDNREPIQVAVGGPDFESATEWAQQLLALAQNDPLFENLRLDYERTRPQLSVRVDRERAIDVGVDVRSIGRAVQTFLGGREVTEYLDQGDLYKVILQARPADRASPSDLSNINVRTAGGALVPLESFVSLEESGTVRDLTRINRAPSVIVTGTPAASASLGAALDRLEALANENLPPGATINYLGQSLDYRDSSAQLFITFGLAFLLVYLALAAQFESLVHPVTILVAAPLAVTGGLATLLFTGASLNIYSQIGLILLIGLMTKNGILLVEFANQLRAKGMSVRDAAREASMIRVRPILMTTISTILGAVPLVLASGAGAEGRRAIGLVIIGGMGFATLLTLFLIPALYALLAPLTHPAARRERLLLEQLESLGETPPVHVRPAGA